MRQSDLVCKSENLTVMLLPRGLPQRRKNRMPRACWVIAHRDGATSRRYGREAVQGPSPLRSYRSRNVPGRWVIAQSDGATFRRYSSRALRKSKVRGEGAFGGGEPQRPAARSSIRASISCDSRRKHPLPEVRRGRGSGGQSGERKSAPGRGSAGWRWNARLLNCVSPSMPPVRPGSDLCAAANQAPAPAITCAGESGPCGWSRRARSPPPPGPACG